MSHLRTLLFYLMLLASFYTFFAVPFLSIQQVLNKVVFAGWIVSLSFAGAMILIIFRTHTILRQYISIFAEILTRVPIAWWLGGVIVFGLLLRLIWILFFPAQPASDGATYFYLATRISSGETYFVGGKWAYWPPGYPLLLSGLFMFFSSSLLVVKGMNLFLFIGTVLVIYFLARELADEAVARLSTLFVTIWPSYLTWAGLPIKELVLIFIMPCTLLLFLLATKSTTIRNKLILTIICGLLLGIASLIQPSMILFPSVLVLTVLIARLSIFWSMAQIIIIVLCMGVIIAPWTLRNYKVFDQFVLISTNSGGVFYRANNPLATGGYTPRGEINLSVYDELEADSIGRKLAIQWIRENPINFFLLALQKQVLFLGDDAMGSYSTLRISNLQVSNTTYYVVKGISNLFWLLAWVCIAVGMLGLIKRNESAQSCLMFILVLSFFYLFSLHSIFESASKYHMPLIGIFAILASIGAYGEKISKKENRHDEKINV